jgi:hypothetical protein
MPDREPAPRALVIFVLPTLHLLLALLLTAITLTAIMSLLVSFRLGDMMARPNPFDNYALVWPGQSLADVAEYAHRTPEGHIACQSRTPILNEYPGLLLLAIPNTDIFYGPPQPVTCMDAIEKGTFRSVSITLKNGRIQELNLFSDFLQQEVLFLYWGAPDAITKGQNDQSLYLNWDRSTYTATAMLTKPYLVVSLVTLRAK